MGVGGGLGGGVGGSPRTGGPAPPAPHHPGAGGGPPGACLSKGAGPHGGCPPAGMPAGGAAAGGFRRPQGGKVRLTDHYRTQAGL